MTSREIADLTGTDLSNVHRDIRKMLGDLDASVLKDVLYDIRSMFDQLEISWAEFSAQYKDSTGRTLPMFALPKDLTITLVSGYSIPMRHKIVTRWMELEGQALSFEQMPTLSHGASL